MLVSDRASTLQFSNKVRCTGEDEALKNYKMCVCTLCFATNHKGKAHALVSVSSTHTV